MVEQYPHYLFLVVPSESFRNADGDFVEGESHIEFISKCRYETNGAGTQLQVGGGNYIISGATVYAPITGNSAMIAKGSTIIVADDESRTMVRCEKEILESDISSFHLRIWL